MNDMNQDNKKKDVNVKKSFGIMVIVAVLLMAFVGYGVQHYIDTNSIATISITGSTNAETADAFEQTIECAKGDNITISGVSLNIKRISHEGTVSFVVERGNLYDEEKNIVKSGVLSKRDRKHYYIDGGSIYLQVNSSRNR